MNLLYWYLISALQCWF